jgi:hypothetical protein
MTTLLGRCERPGCGTVYSGPLNLRREGQGLMGCLGCFVQDAPKCARRVRHAAADLLAYLSRRNASRRTASGKIAL